MEVTALNNGFALQMGQQQSKAKTNDDSQQTPLNVAKNIAPLQAQFVERAQKVQETEKADPNATGLNQQNDDLAELNQKVQEKLKNSGMKISLEVDEKTERVLVLVKDPVTDEVIRKIPPEELLKASEAAREMQQAENSDAKGNLDVKF